MAGTCDMKDLYDEWIYPEPVTKYPTPATRSLFPVRGYRNLLGKYQQCFLAMLKLHR
jgi:hypothetical protein